MAVRTAAMGEHRALRKAYAIRNDRFLSGSLNVTNPNQIRFSKWFGFVFYNRSENCGSFCKTGDEFVILCVSCTLFGICDIPNDTYRRIDDVQQEKSDVQHIIQHLCGVVSLVGDNNDFPFAVFVLENGN